jgi:putative flippase GtrA
MSKHKKDSKLALHATWHCLMGCGLGEVLGMIIATGLAMSATNGIILAVSLGIIFGFTLGMRPLIKDGYSFKQAFKQVLVAEGLSIAFMETAEVLTEIYVPGVMEAKLNDGIFWLGMLLALIAGFIAAFPVNYIMIKKGFGHNH